MSYHKIIINVQKNSSTKVYQKFNTINLIKELKERELNLPVYAKKKLNTNCTCISLLNQQPSFTHKNSKLRLSILRINKSAIIFHQYVAIEV
jgi:hypothetical protein